MPTGECQRRNAATSHDAVNACSRLGAGTVPRERHENERGIAMSYEAEDTLKDPGSNSPPGADVRSPSDTDDEAGSGAGDAGASSPTGDDEDDAG